MKRALAALPVLALLAACGGNENDGCQDVPREYLFHLAVSAPDGRTASLYAEGVLAEQDGALHVFHFDGDAPFTLRIDGSAVPAQEFAFAEGDVGTATLSGPCTDRSYPNAAHFECAVSGAGGLAGTLDVEASDVVEQVCP